MIIKNNLGLEVSIENSDMAYVVSKYQHKFDDIETLTEFEKTAKRYALNAAIIGAFTGLLMYGVSKYASELRDEATRDVLREINQDERATDVIKEMLYGGK